MKKKYRIKATKRTWLEIECDSSLSQQEVYDLAKEKLKSNKKVEWEEPSLNIIEIQIDRSTEHSNVTAKTKINLLKAIDPLTNKIKEN
jgi:hypothetical protein